MASRVRLADVHDGLSNTLMIGEAEPDPELPRIGSTVNAQYRQEDHWCMGGDDMDNWEGTDWSECGGSTAVSINFRRPGRRSPVHLD